jgi:hypothetical protein
VAQKEGAMSKTVEEILAEVKADIDELSDTFKEYMEGGFQIHEVIRFALKAGTKLIDAVENLQDVPGETKKKAVKKAIKDIYKERDPDIPWVPEPFETWLEDFLLDKVLDSFIDLIVRRKKEANG